MPKVSVSRNCLEIVTDYVFDDEREDFASMISEGNDDFLSDGAFFENVGFEELSDEGLESLVKYIGELVDDDYDEIVNWLAYHGNSTHVFASAVQLRVEAKLMSQPKLSKECTRKLREVAYGC